VAATGFDLDTTLLSAQPGVGRIAPAATQVTASEPHEDSRPPYMNPLALERAKDLDQIRLHDD
jgi:hypothetical protein